MVGAVPGMPTVPAMSIVPFMTTVCVVPGMSVVSGMSIVVPGMIGGLSLDGNSMTLMITGPSMLGVVVATVSTMVGMRRVRHRVAVVRVGILVEAGRFAAGRVCRHGGFVVVRVWVGHDDRFRFAVGGQAACAYFAGSASNIGPQAAQHR